MKAQASCLLLCLTLAACGGSADDPPPAKQAGPAAKSQEANNPPSGDGAPKSRTLTISQAAHQAVLDRLGVLEKITAELKPLITPKRDPEGALAKEAALQALFTDYRQLAKIAMDEGMKLSEIDRMAAKLMPEKFRSVRGEFAQYSGLVKGLGEPQRAMMERLMGTDSPAATAVPDALMEHLNHLKTPAADPTSGGRGAPAVPAQDE